MELISTDSSKALLKSRKRCACLRTWVLVVHNDFLQVEGYERRGDDVDLRNLRRVFQTERACKFAELTNCSKEQILETLSSQDKFIQLFHPDQCRKLIL